MTLSLDYAREIILAFEVSPVDLETVLSEEAYILLYARHTPRGLSLLVRNENVYSDGKIKRNMEAISLSNSGKKRNSKTKLSTLVQGTNSETLNHWSESHHYPNDFTDNLILDSDGRRFHPMQGNHIVDSLSDSSSVFSISDASSYSADSTKDFRADDLSDYIFGSSSYRP